MPWCKKLGYTRIHINKFYPLQDYSICVGKFPSRLGFLSSEMTTALQINLYSTFIKQLFCKPRTINTRCSNRHTLTCLVWDHLCITWSNYFLGLLWKSKYESINYEAANFKLPYFNDVLFRYLDELSPIKTKEY